MVKIRISKHISRCSFWILSATDTLDSTEVGSLALCVMRSVNHFGGGVRGV